MGHRMSRKIRGGMSAADAFPLVAASPAIAAGLKRLKASRNARVGRLQVNVTLQAASGRQVMIRTPRFERDSTAARFALKEANEQHGEQGWLVLVVF